MTFGLELLLRISIDVLFIFIGWKAFVHYWHFRDREHLYFAVFFAMLTVSTLFSELALFEAYRSSTEGRLFGIALTALPVLILLLAAHIRPLPRWMMTAALGGFVYTVAVLLFTDWREDSTLWLYAIAGALYVSVQVIGAYVFWRESRRSVGMTRNRYTYIVAGCILLSLSILVLLWYAYLPDVTQQLYSIYVILSALTALSFVVGFEPPAIVRKGWQAAQITEYQSQIIGTLINKPAEQILRYLASSSLRALGGQAAIIVSYDTAKQRLSLNSQHEVLDFPVPVGLLDRFGELLTQFQPQARYLRLRDVPEASVTASTMEGFQANALFSVPVVNLPNALTVLVITMRSGTLFVDEDLAILTRYAEQARAILENNSLIAATQEMVEELRGETDDLEVLVMERERALRASEDELRRRLVQMSALYRELESFSNSVSHDLRAPLRAISGFANALAEDFGGALPPDAALYVERIKANTVKMDQLMNDMLKLSKLSRSEMAFTDVDLTDTAVRVGHELRAKYPAHEVAFSVDPSMSATADPALAKILLTNLLGNAWQFTLHTPEPKVSLSQTVINGERVFRVSDNGAGFDMAYAAKLFKPFQRLHTQDEFEGSGIGLAIVQRIVNRHGGRVWAEGEPDKGARFYFTLPGRVT